MCDVDARLVQAAQFHAGKLHKQLFPYSHGQKPCRDTVQPSWPRKLGFSLSLSVDATEKLLLPKIWISPPPLLTAIDPEEEAMYTLITILLIPVGSNRPVGSSQFYRLSHLQYF